MIALCEQILSQIFSVDQLKAYSTWMAQIEYTAAQLKGQ